MQVLEEFANNLSLRKGGSKGLQKLINSQMVGTIELSTGLQISGNFSRTILDEENEVIFFETEGPTALAYREKELIGHGIETHKNGFSSPLGKLKNINLAIEDMGPVDLKAYNFYDGKHLSFEFESGIKVEGLNVTGIRSLQGKLLLIQLKDCTVSYNDEELFTPEDGVYNMVVGKDIVSAFAGSADSSSFPNLYSKSSTLTIKKERSDSLTDLEKHYQSIREYREKNSNDAAFLKNLFQELKSEHPEEWLLMFEILETSKDEAFNQLIRDHLNKLAVDSPKVKSLIEDGLELIEEGLPV